MSSPTPPFFIPFSRRRLLQSLALASAGFTAPGAFAEMLTLTPYMTEGPYYPDTLPLDQDNDLVQVNDHATDALGTVTLLSGHILDTKGAPLKNALVELWQADNNGTYIHTSGAGRNERDNGFQGYGKFETDSKGAWRFRTIKPGLYTGRTRHYHFGVTLPGQKRRFTTQLFFAGEPGNERDGVLRGVRDAAQRMSVIRDFTPVEGTKELKATWDIVIGSTLGDMEGGHGMEAPPERRRDAPRPSAAGRPEPELENLIRPSMPF